MEIIFSNFLNLLAIGSFSKEGEIKPMSRFKWRQMLELAKTYDVTDYVSAGIIRTSTRNSRLIQKDIVEEVYAKFDTAQRPEVRERGAAELMREATGKFELFTLKRKLKTIVHDELHAIDTSMATLTLLYMIIDNINGIIYEGIDFRRTIELGEYLRRHGDKTDFVKADLWLRSLGISKPANLVGNYLTELFGFSADEVQFMSRTDRKTRLKALRPLKYTLGRAVDEEDRRNYVSKLSMRLHIPDACILGRFAYFPTEVVSKFIVGVGRSIANIEE